MLGRSIYPTSYSTLMHQVLRQIVKRRRKFIGRVSYFSAQSTLTLDFCLMRESRSATSRWVSDHKLVRSAVKPSADSSPNPLVEGQC